MSLSSNNQYTMRGTPPPAENAAQPSSSTKSWASPLSREVLLSDKLPANTSPCRQTPTPPLVEFAEDDHHDWETGAKGSKPSTGNKLAPYRGRSRTQNHSLPGMTPHGISRSRTSSPVGQAGLKCGKSPGCLRHADDALQNASLQQSSWTNATSGRAPRHHAACRFSYEDFKHTQFVEWLERERS